MRVVIFANGELDDPAAAARWVRPGDCIVAADGGTCHALATGLTPAVVIGDLDSLSPETRTVLTAAGTQFRPYPPQKDETDLELALLWAAAQAAEEIVVLGALGGRPDQALANLLLLALPALAQKRVRLLAGPWEITLLRSGETAHFEGAPGETLSLLPLGGDVEGISTMGLAYPLHAETLHFGPARGVSNRFTGTTATVTITRGLLWCFHEHGT